MKIVKQSTLVERWQVISTHETNLCRDKDSQPDSVENQRLIQTIANDKSWSPECPAIFVPMSNWLFSGLTAEEYVQAEMDRRTARFAALSNDPVKNATELVAFKATYCNPKGDLYKLTVKNAYWAFSGHQRLQRVFDGAVRLYYEERFAAEEASKKAGEPFDGYPEFSMLIPCSVREYDSTTEILLKQMEGNEQQSIQNSLTTLDLVKCARELIGYEPMPKMNESQFRKGCARAGTASAGDATRFPWLIAECDHAMKGCGLYEGVMAPAEISVDGKKVGNADYIPLANISVKNKTNPVENISVIARLIERDLSGLTAYANNSKTKDNVSALEREVLDRAYPWDKVEFKNWVEGRKPNNPSNAGKTLVTVGDKALSLNAIKQMKKQPALPEAVGQYLDAIVSGNSEDKRLNVICLAKEALDAALKLAGEPQFVSVLTTLSVLHDGDKPRFDAIVAQFVELVK